MNRMSFFILAMLIALTAISVAAFVGFKKGPESQFKIKADSNIVLFGVTPWGDQRQVKEAYKPLLEYLGEKTGKKFQLLVMEDYDVAVDDIVDGYIDISVISPVCYVRAKAREPGIQYISTVAREQDGKLAATFKGYLVAPSPKFKGHTLDDFLGQPEKHNFAFVTRSSASGWAYPMAMFKKRGFDPYKAFKSVTVFENHPSMTDAMAEGKVDLGATWEYNLERAEEKHGKIFQIIYTTPDIPGLSWVAAKKVNPLLVEKIKQVQMEISASGELRKKLLKDTPEKGWLGVDPVHYDGVKEVMEYVGEFK